MKILITGATGYIGQRLVGFLLRQQCEIISASRKPLNNTTPHIYFNFDNIGEFRCPSDIDAIIHLAAKTSSGVITQKQEIAAANHMLEEARKINARFIFISSQTARADAPTEYGKTKFLIEEKILRAANGYIIRPGLVYGGREQGLFGTLVKLIRVLPIIPAFKPAPAVQPVHVDDLSLSIWRLINYSVNDHNRSFCIAQMQSISFTEFLQYIAVYRLHKFRIALPFPIVFIDVLKKIFGVRLSDRLGLQRLDSLFQLPIMNTDGDLGRLGITLRSLESGMHISGNHLRREFIKEAHILLTYILKTKPESSLIRRYVKMIEVLKKSEPLTLPWFVTSWPITLALLEGNNAELSWRLDAATLISEASVQGASRFLELNTKTHIIFSLMNMARAISAEIIWRSISLIINPFISLLKRE